MDARTAGILMEMRQGKGGGHVDAGTLPRGPIDDEGDLYGLGASLSPVTKSSGDRSEGTESNDGLGRGYAGLIAERIVEDRISVCNSSTPSTGANHSIEARRLSQAPSQPSSASLSRSNRGASRRSTLFPAQKNTLHGSEPTGSNSIMPPSGLVPVPVEPLTVVS
ncbi:hypothetical protein GQ44DRAFT_710489 [Phaeosphaeriaceae sp. PMI808]|nr:hypothetical protein GQ44DRAFT_710489 [Phaeosphaeriaceae sp. PMI808]